MAAKDQKQQLSTVTIRVVQVFASNYTPHYRGFSAKVVASKGGNKRKKETVQTFYGYLPCYSPGIEYIVTVDEKNKVILRNSWKRITWWLTEEFVSSELRDHWKDGTLKSICEFFQVPISREEEFEDLKCFKGAHELFQRHFWPNIWFDIACLQNEGKNVYSSYVLESKAPLITGWQKHLDKDLLTGLLLHKPQLSKLSWDLVAELLNKAKDRLKGGSLSPENIEWEIRQKRNEETERIIMGSVKKSIIQTLAYPPKPEHDYRTPPATFSYVYKLIDNVESKLEWSGESTLTHRIEIPAIKTFILDSKILYEVGENNWTLPLHIQDASSINNFMDKYYYTENKPFPITLDEALALRCCIISTAGHNAYGVFNRLVERMDEDGVAFFCPDPDTAREFNVQTDVIAWPEPGARIHTPKIAVFCFSHAYSLKQLSTVMSIFTYKDPTQWPEKVLFFGDPKLCGNQGIGSPFQELIEGGRTPVFDLTWQTMGSQNPYSEGIQHLIQNLETTTKSTKIPWSEDVQICSPEKFKELYNALLASENPDTYHILCDTFTKIRELESEVRSRPPHGLHVHDKVMLIEKNQLDWIEKTWTVNLEGKALEEPRNIAMTNHINHCISLHKDQVSDHSVCCKVPTAGRYCLTVHPVKWATIQTFRDNKVPRRDHVVVIVTEETRKKYIYHAACMATKKITLVCTMQDLDKVLSRPLPQRKPISLIEYTVDPQKRVTM